MIWHFGTFDAVQTGLKGLSLNVDHQMPFFSAGSRDKDNKLYGLNNLGFAETMRPAKVAWPGKTNGMTRAAIADRLLNKLVC
jgi:hypothetical protein